MNLSKKRCPSLATSYKISTPIHHLPLRYHSRHHKQQWRWRLNPSICPLSLNFPPPTPSKTLISNSFCPNYTLKNHPLSAFANPLRPIPLISQYPHPTPMAPDPPLRPEVNYSSSATNLQLLPPPFLKK